VNSYEAARNGPYLLRAITGPHPGRYLTGAKGARSDWTDNPDEAMRFPTAAEANALWRGDPDLIKIAVTNVPVRDLLPP